MSLPIFQDHNKNLMLLQTNWSSVLNPVVESPLNKSNVLSNVKLINGVTVINHLLGRQMQGWFLTDINGAATVYRSQPFNPLTLTLTSSAAVTVSIGVF